jgi:hypothetical protein
MFAHLLCIQTRTRQASTSFQIPLHHPSARVSIHMLNAHSLSRTQKVATRLHAMKRSTRQLIGHGYNNFTTRYPIGGRVLGVPGGNGVLEFWEGNISYAYCTGDHGTLFDFYEFSLYIKDKNVSYPLFLRHAICHVGSSRGMDVISLTTKAALELVNQPLMETET